jgi:ATP-dependent helicase/nuclease subunit B
LPARRERTAGLGSFVRQCFPWSAKAGSVALSGALSEGCGRVGLRLLIGRPAASRVAFAARVRELRDQDPLSPITVLVGTSLQRPFFARWLAARLGGHANIRILMPGDLALLLGAPVLVEAGRRALPPLADRVLLAEVARAHPGYFAPVAETPGFAEALYRLVRELRGAGTDLADLAALLGGLTDAPEKAASLAEILASFEARRAFFYGPDDALAVADPERLDGLGLLVWGVLDLPPALERLLVGVAQRLPVDIFVPDVPAAAESPLGTLRERLIAGGAELSSLSEPDTPDSALGLMRRVLFTAPSGPGVAADGTVRLVSAPDPAREVRAAARACLAWAQEGVAFWDMAVAYRHGEAYRPLVEAVFIEAGIPVYLHEGSPLAERPLGRQTLALLELYESDFSRRSVMDFLTDARLPSELHDEFGGVPAARWDSVSRQAGVVAGAAQWAQRLAMLQRELAGDDENDAPAWVSERAADVGELARFIADLNAQLHAHPGRAPWSTHLDFLAGLLSRYVQGAEEVVDALRGLERFTALDAEVEFERFLDVVRRALGTLRSEDVLEGRAGAFARRGVNVVAVNSLPGIEFARVWILGATERAFPPPARQDPILLDAERARISERAGALLAPRAARGTEEALQFALACEAAREKLVVSYARRSTGESRPRLPSVFFRELASQLAGERVSAARAPLLQRPDVERIPGDAIGAPIAGGRYATDAAIVSVAAAGAISEAERDRTYLQATVTQPWAIATFERAVPAFARALAAARARRSDRYSEWDGALSERALAAIASLVPVDRTFSPTALESYAKCPQQFLIGDVLRIKAIEEPERTVRIDSLRRGNLCHRILERFHAESRQPGAPSLAPDARERMRAIAEQECDASEARGETGYPAMWAADRLEVIDDCLQWLEVEREDPLTALLPLGACEARFGPRHRGEQVGALSRDEPIAVQLAGRELLLSGRIDRINWDEARTRFRVIDYKTGRVRDEKSAQLQGGRMLQLPLYVLAGAELLGLDPFGGQAAYVYPTRRGQFRTIDWTGEQLAERHEQVLGALGAVLDGIARGDFMVAPWDPDSACRYCDFDAICPRGRSAYVERKAADERLSRFTDELRSIQ